MKTLRGLGSPINDVGVTRVRQHKTLLRRSSGSSGQVQLVCIGSTLEIKALDIPWVHKFPSIKGMSI